MLRNIKKKIRLIIYDFEIPHNKIKAMEGLETNYFPFLTKEATTFFKHIETKTNSK